MPHPGTQIWIILISGCGSIDNAVASDPEVRGLNPVIGNFFVQNVLAFNSWKDEMKD